VLDQEDGDKRPVRTMAKPISVSSVRLVFPYTDPETGVTRDVIATKIVNGNIFHDRYTGRKSWARYVAGLDIIIPWPKLEPKKHKDYDCDTLRIDVEVKTFIPTLLRPPMPSTVIDELRNKFSKFRTRHDEEYIQKKEQEEEEKQRKLKMTAEMRTPLKELRRAELKQLKAKGKPKLTDEMLVKIGEVIAKNSLLEGTVAQQTVQDQAPAAL
jgi:large subunit ribosomal protein L24